MDAPAKPTVDTITIEFTEITLKPTALIMCTACVAGVTHRYVGGKRIAVVCPICGGTMKVAPPGCTVISVAGGIPCRR